MKKSKKRCVTWPYCGTNYKIKNSGKTNKGIFMLGFPGYGGPLFKPDDSDNDSDLDVGTDTDTGVDAGTDAGGEGMGESLLEAKREVRRYYLKPQSI